MDTFTPISALAGGALIGAASALLLWLNGRIAGISGIASGLLGLTSREALWRALFLIALVAGAAAGCLLGATAPQPREQFPAWLLGVAGMLLGYGTSLADGCTSGHGVCGLGRLSVRSLVAVAVFLGVAIVTTWVVRHGFGVR